MPSSTSSSSFRRGIPAFGPILRTVGFFTLFLVLGWEIYCRILGYGPSLNDSPDLWAIQRKKVERDSIVIIGTSRALYDLDLNELEKGLGKRPIQLAIVGSCAVPVLENLADDPSFRGLLIVDVVPMSYFSPLETPMEVSLNAIKRYKEQTVAQLASQYLGMLLEERFAFLKSNELSLEAYLRELPVPSRALAVPPSNRPLYFRVVDRERHARLIDKAVQPGELQNKIQQSWILPPAPGPNWMSPERYEEQTKAIAEERFRKIAHSVEKLRERGAKVVFLRLPVSGRLKELEEQFSPKSGAWTRILSESNAPGIHFEDFPELAGFSCPEWSHLSAPDSVEFTRRLMPYLKQALSLGKG